MTKLSISLLALAFALLSLGIYRAVTAAHSQPAAQCFTAQQKDHVIGLSQAAIDDAFKEQVKSLFDVWVRDTTEQPKRAMTGMANNLSAYHRARANILQWAPAVCS
jgi:hypothetical protein